MEERNLSLKEATKFLLEPAARDQAPSITNWKNIVETFIESRSDRRGTTLRDLKTRMRRVLETLYAEGQFLFIGCYNKFSFRVLFRFGGTSNGIKP